MLLISKVPRSLENKTTVFGFEIPELILIFVYLSLSNYIFGRTALKIPVVWGGTLLMAVVVILTKRKKPDGYLLHLIEYYRTPEVLSAGERDLKFTGYLRENSEAGPENDESIPNE